MFTLFSLLEDKKEAQMVVTLEVVPFLLFGGATYTNKYLAIENALFKH